MKFTGFGLANFRSFDAKGGSIVDYGKINVLIGKNNSGKSNILRFLQYLCSPSLRNEISTPLNNHRRIGGGAKIYLHFVLEKNEIPNDIFDRYYCSKEPYFEILADLSQLRNCLELKINSRSISDYDFQHLVNLYYTLTNSRPSFSNHQDVVERIKNILPAMAFESFQRMLANLIYVPAIREVRPDNEIKEGQFDLSGRNLIETLHYMQHPPSGKESEQQAFLHIQDLIRDLLGVKELKLEIQNDKKEIILNIYGNRLPLSSFGTGVHELIIICSTLAIHKNCFVCIEEPEIHLHPELLRRFMKFLATTENKYFIATHSNVLLDADETTAIYHITYDGNASQITKNHTNEHSRAILKDLRYHASDLLQTNGIIWVEGPSDRIYLKRWLELSDPTFNLNFIEGVHYSIMFYGGACLANFTACDTGPSEEFVELLRINSNAIVMIDRDSVLPDQKMRDYKTRIQSEVGEDKCWITEGKEIENYLPETLLRKYLLARHGDAMKKDYTKHFMKTSKIDQWFKDAIEGKNFNYGCDKKGNAKAICSLMTEDDMDMHDLQEWILRIKETINVWNCE